MSDMDGVSKCGKIVRRAYEWGHKAIAITDHGVVQAFPDAWHEYCDIKKECKREGKECDFKVIYGVEAYLVDDLKDMIVNPRGQKLDDTYVVFDLETTGFSAKSDKIIEIGAVKVTNGKIVDRFSTFVNPERPIPFRIEKLTSINDNMVINQPTIDEILPKFMEFCKGATMQILT
jgi:DNA polymerase-3 subunit alpha (Gram-positive type)